MHMCFMVVGVLNLNIEEHYNFYFELKKKKSLWYVTWKENTSFFSCLCQPIKATG